ncbi:MAG: SBBP repeat-containing protein [Mariprofundus sp.]|nr:SBBP repeat-containing protein [Mariprofundus sp.]
MNINITTAVLAALLTFTPAHAATLNAITIFSDNSKANLSAIHAATNGDIYFSDAYTQSIKAIDKQSGIAYSVAQANVGGNSSIYSVSGLATDSSGNIYVADSQTHTLSKITVTNGAKSAPVIIAGTGAAGYTGDNGLASSAQFNAPAGIAIDSYDDIYIADMGNNVIRKISNGIITTIAGTGTAGYSGNNSPAINANLNAPYGLAIDTSFALYVTELGNHTLRRILGGNISTLTGTGTAGFSGDGQLAGLAQLNSPRGVAVDSLGNIYIADTGNSRIRKLENLFIDSVASVSSPSAITVDRIDDTFVLDNANKQILKFNTGATHGSQKTVSCIANSFDTVQTLCFLLLLLAIIFNVRKREGY